MQKIHDYIESLGFIPIDDKCFKFDDFYVELTYSSINIYRYEINRNCKLFSFAKRKDEVLWKAYLNDLISQSEAIAFNNLIDNVELLVEVLNE